MGWNKLDAFCTAEQKKRNEAVKKVAKKVAKKTAKNAAVKGEPKGEEEGEQQPGDGAQVNFEDYKGARKVLRHAVKAVVKEKSARIAEKIVSKAEAGDMRGTEMMLQLIEKKKPGKEAKKKKRDGPSWAELLASEPEWHEGKGDEKAAS